MWGGLFEEWNLSDVAALSHVAAPLLLSHVGRPLIGMAPIWGRLVLGVEPIYQRGAALRTTPEYDPAA